MEQKDFDEEWEEVGGSYDEEDYDDFDSYTFERKKEELVGKLVGSFEGEYGNRGYIIEIDESTARIVWASSVQLRDSLPDVPTGSKVKITYNGTVETDKGHEMKDYNVEVPKAD